GQAFHPAELTGEDGCGGGFRQKSRPVLAAWAQFRGALQSRGRGRIATPAPGSVGRLLQGGRHVLVGAQGCGGEMPGSAVGLLAQQLREIEMRPAAFLDGRGMIDGRADERVAEGDPGSLLAYETGLF